MLTNKKVMEIFGEYLAEDQALDVVWTRRGYAVMLWDYTGGDWSDVMCCATPEQLFDKLLSSFVGYQEYRMMKGKGHLEEKERDRIQEMCLPFLEKRKEVEK